MQHMHCNIPCMIDCWANPAVHLSFYQRARWQHLRFRLSFESPGGKRSSKKEGFCQNAKPWNAKFLLTCDWKGCVEPDATMTTVAVAQKSDQILAAKEPKILPKVAQKLATVMFLSKSAAIQNSHESHQIFSLSM